MSITIHEAFGLNPDVKVTVVKSAVRKDGLEESPRTLGEQLADRPSQQAQREMADRKAYLERQITVKETEYFHYGVSRQRQAQLSVEIDSLRIELNLLRENLATRNTGVAKTDRARGRDALNTLMRTPSVAKSESEPLVTTTVTKTQEPIQKAALPAMGKDKYEERDGDELGRLLRL